MTGQVSGVRSALSHAGRTVIPDRVAPGPTLRQVIADRREIAAMTRERVASPLVTLRFYATTTPGKLVIILLAMIVACGLTGWYSSAALTSRSSTLSSLIDRSEPQAEAAEVLYSSLSVADASANSAFISGGRETPELRANFMNSIATASTALIAATDGYREGAAPHSEDEESARADLNTLAVKIPAYTGLVETARTNNRLGYPVGSAYLTVASSLMQNTILPAAQRLYEQRSAAISEPQRTLTVPPWGVYVALFLIIGMLIATGRYLARRTRRHFNIGLIAALTAMVLGTVWLLASGLMSVAAANTAKVSGADPLHTLTSMRILTQQARSAETLSLVRRSDPGELDRTFMDAMDKIRTEADALRADPDLADDPGVTDRLEDVKSAVVRWRSAHIEVARLLTNGDFTGARALTVGEGTISTATAYSEANTALVAAINDARSTFRTNINTAQRVLGFTGGGIAVLCVVAALAVFGGLFPRIREYR
ncbi:MULTISPECIES: hypothetical protein [Gordonia]|uniref:Chemotaxis methyl-accepting receptor HlyB-like 4HB MCP domain-containing protein n=1 Tax=Gordonia malaquae NBRC 108250 TaxID=1223542 RepID=M3VEM4_GORML|nr:hypothetical protein [Gordonia malaquae]GAC79404.1 hypothetical protein GM1_009_00170 [Gordonia malaquae NBRC 108250]SEE29409.1 hypothetical protein SAMN04488550_4232 [Gordonia malaquae]